MSDYDYLIIMTRAKNPITTRHNWNSDNRWISEWPRLTWSAVMFFSWRYWFFSFLEICDKMKYKKFPFQIRWILVNYILWGNWSKIVSKFSRIISKPTLDQIRTNLIKNDKSFLVTSITVSILEEIGLN